MTLKQIIDKFKTKSKPRTDEEIKKIMEQRQADNLVKAAKLRHLIKDQTGWKEACDIIQDYIDTCNMTKLRHRLDTADDKTIQEFKYIDRDIYILNWVLQIPQQFIYKIERKQEELTKEPEDVERYGV